MTPGRRTGALVAILALCVAGPTIHAAADSSYAREDPFVVRSFDESTGSRALGDGIAYGPHRDGQRPGGPSPSKADVLEDLRLIARRWNLIRLYGSVGPAESILVVIRAERLPLRVMLGVWVAPEESRDSTGRVVATFPDARAANRAEIEAGVRLARDYPEIVAALCAGNETQVFWSAHRVPEPLLVAALRELRARSEKPVTTGDDYLYWKTPGSASVAAEVDFIVSHFHPLWAGQLPDSALGWTRRAVAEVRARHPERRVVIGETGWATAKLSTGEQGTLMKGTVGEREQAAYGTALAAWANEERTLTF
ncbi:MAG TPA: hypothetical protein VFT32_01875, partial [Candidatus Eisenbacteria bacterium]|nr:hypothetical protein [Candidatus Eisenbacteria bacterium]